MGVIKKILYRGKILKSQRYNNFFLDMEENIHIHYRDLRIELSRSEFEDFTNTFFKQSMELLSIIQQKNYQDGKLPNSNQEDVRIWTESKLKAEVKYHPQRFSLEECTDGYHFHYRNYKLLIDKDDFAKITDLFNSLDINGAYAETYDEVLELLEANEVDFIPDKGNVPGQILAIATPPYHLPKIKSILNTIGFTQGSGKEADTLIGKQLKVIVKSTKQHKALDYRRFRGYRSTERLVDYLSRLGKSIQANKLNLIKCQVLDVYYALKNDQPLTVDIDPQNWLYIEDNQQVIFPYLSKVSKGKIDAEALYAKWANLLAPLELAFVKPTKEVIAEIDQRSLKTQIDAVLRQEVAAYGAVDKVYVMGSVTRNDLGRYHAPFVHGKMAKLGSDIDILIEINPEREIDIPADWHLYNSEASNHCAVYHIFEIPMPLTQPMWAERFPNIPFTPHLIDAYVSFPSRGFEAEKEAFLQKFKATLFYDRVRDGTFYRNVEEHKIAVYLMQQFGFQQLTIERLPVSTENIIYKVFVDQHTYILKLFKVSGNYRQARVAEHTLYEARLVNALKARGLAIAGIIQTSETEILNINDYSALLFERIPGNIKQKPDYPLPIITQTLADIHHSQIEQALELSCDFPFDETCMIWLPTFEQFSQKTDLDPEITEAFAQLEPLAARCHPGENRSYLFARSPHIHNHGDMTPKNVIVVNETESYLFDFNNAFYGPRIIDVIDGGFEFSLAEKYIHLADFARFDAFIEAYTQHTPLTPEEQEDIPRWIELIGIIKFTKEVRVLLQNPNEQLRKKRALAITEFVLARAPR